MWQIARELYLAKNNIPAGARPIVPTTSWQMLSSSKGIDSGAATAQSQVSTMDLEMMVVERRYGRRQRCKWEETNAAERKKKQLLCCCGA